MYWTCQNDGRYLAKNEKCAVGVFFLQKKLDWMVKNEYLCRHETGNE